VFGNRGPADMNPMGCFLGMSLSLRFARFFCRSLVGGCLAILAVGTVAGGVAGEGDSGNRVTLSATGLRGPVWIPSVRDQGTGWVVGGARTVSVVLPEDGGAPFAAPVRVADRQLTGWKHGKRWLSKEGRPAPPGKLPRGAVVTAVYEVIPIDRSPKPDHFATNNQGRWNRWPLSVHVDPKIPEDIRNVVWEGIRRWQFATGGAIALVEGKDEAAADIAVAFADLPGDRSGQTTTRGRTADDGRFDLEQAKIFLSTELVDAKDSDFRAAVAAVASHEMGHALGLLGKPSGGHSDDPRDTMTRVVTARTVWPTARDINSLAIAYPSRFERTKQ